MSNDTPMFTETGTGTGTSLLEKVEELTEFMVFGDESPGCEINHRTTKCQEVAVARRRFKCVPYGFNMCAAATKVTRLALEHSDKRCFCRKIIGECWFIIDI